jgi:hypothetical protein
LLQAAKDLRLLCGELLRREDGISRFSGVELHFVHPASDRHRALGAQIAPVEMGRTLTARDRFDQRLFRKMTLTKNDINEPHD